MTSLTRWFSPLLKGGPIRGKRGKLFRKTFLEEQFKGRKGGGWEQEGEYRLYQCWSRRKRGEEQGVAGAAQKGSVRRNGGGEGSRISFIVGGWRGGGW